MSQKCVKLRSALPIFFTASCLVMCMSMSAKASEKVESISQYGITWYFDKPVSAGQFITGDWWVIGPVTVTKVTPQPGQIESTNGKEVKSRYGAAATRPDNSMRNGSMIVLKSGGQQGYDSRLKNYKAEDSVKFPIKLAPETSLISTISNGEEKVDTLVHKMMWRSEKQGYLVLKSAAVLTVLDKEPPADAFRPPYAGTSKPIYRFKDVDTSKLLNLAPPSKMPQWATFERYLQRPWLEHMTGWLHQHLGPSENQVNYGREFSRVTGIAGLMLNTKASLDTKKPLLIGLIQLGIDITGVIDAGRQYSADGGHYSGRKFPVVFAGYMLNNERMLNATKLSNFAEDLQTYYGKGWAGQKALFQIVFHTGKRPPYEHQMPEEWNADGKRSEGYRIVNGTAWPATALCIRIMGLVKPWNHDAWFDYMDRWMSADDPYAAGRKKSSDAKYQKRPKQESKSIDPFVDQMWKEYRSKYDKPEWAEKAKVWVWKNNTGEWQDNPRPADTVEEYTPPAQ